LKSSKYELNAVASAATKPEAARVQPPKTRRPTGALVISAVSAKDRPKSAVADDGGCRGVLTIGDCTIEAMDGHLLGLAAWVLNAGAITVTVSKRPEAAWRVKSNAHFSAGEIEELCYSRQLAERDEAWFVKRFATALYCAHNAARQAQGGLDRWNTESLPRVLRLVPPERQVNVTFRRGQA